MSEALPEGVARELTRLGERWQQLPLAQALFAAPRVRALAQALVDATAAHAGMPPARLPDLGPAVALDQLRVTVWDALVAGAVDEPGLSESLAEVRRSLS